MVEYNQNEKVVTISIPVKGLNEFYNYQKSILGILHEIDVKKCHPQVRQDIKYAYKLLNYMMLKPGFLKNAMVFHLDIIDKKNKKK